MSSEDGTKGKIGAGHVSAMGRQGLNELRGALYPESNVAQPTEMGAYGTATPVEVTKERAGEEPQRGEDASIIESRVQQAEASRDTGSRDSIELSKE